ncbi:hypothetical protein RND81_02G109800 [Saponaria officinalis]|uniref:Uncharacterized protein n=1 Tax=Saponaria officinalis TaxID=3572 RepID=A0AAW1MKV3_SAPOF
MRYSNIKSFKDLTMVRTKIEDNLRSGTKAKFMGRGYQGSTFRSAPSSSKTEDSNLINALDTLVSATLELKPKWAFEPLNMSYADALKKLVKNDFLQLLGPTFEPPVDKRSPRWDATAYCDYHQGKGHDTEECFKLKHAIQDLLDSGKIPKPSRPSNKANPLGNHAIFVGSIPIIDCSHLIILSEPEFNGIWFSDEDDEWPPKVEVNKIDYTAVPRKYGKRRTREERAKAMPILRFSTSLALARRS